MSFGDRRGDAGALGTVNNRKSLKVAGFKKTKFSKINTNSNERTYQIES